MPPSLHPPNSSGDSDADDACPCAPACELLLHQLPKGVRATVLCVRCPVHMRRRLAEMGILPGVEVQMKRTAPFGDPIAFQVKGYQLSLRKCDAELISVRPIGEQSAVGKAER